MVQAGIPLDKVTLLYWKLTWSDYRQIFMIDLKYCLPVRHGIWTGLFIPWTCGQVLDWYTKEHLWVVACLGTALQNFPAGILTVFSPWELRFSCNILLFSLPGFEIHLDVCFISTKQMRYPFFISISGLSYIFY